MNLLLTLRKNHVTIIEWIATGVILLSTALNSLNIYPLGPILAVVGSILWTYVAYKWNRRSIMILSIVSALVGAVFLAL